MVDAAATGRDDAYAETAGVFLATHLVSRYAGRDVRMPSVGRRRLQPAINYIRDNLHTDLSLTAMAAAANVSKFHFVRVFKDAVGETPVRYLTRQRLLRARRLLADTALPVGEVAKRCGFVSGDRLLAAFTREYGVSPSRFRSARN